MTSAALFDFRAALAPLMAASPRSQVVAICKVCHRSIEGLAALDQRGSVMHPDSCPDAPGAIEARPDQGDLFDVR